MKDITIIVPIHEFNDNVKALLTRAVKSINDGLEVIFVGPKEVLGEASKVCSKATLVENNGSTDVFTQINVAVMQCVTPYFSVLEFDDEYLDEWLNCLSRELDSRACSVLLPLNECVNDADGKFVSFNNEIAWDASFISEDSELGNVTEDELKAYHDFNVTGGIIKTEDFISVGQLKPEYKIAAWLDFLMRVVRSGKTIFVNPRVTYRHYSLRDGSYTTQINGLVTPEEVDGFLKEIVGE